MYMVRLQHAEQNGNGESRTIYELIETTSTFAPALRAVRVENGQVTEVVGFGESLSARDMVAARETLEDAFRSCTRFYNFGLPK